MSSQSQLRETEQEGGIYLWITFPTRNTGMTNAGTVDTKPRIRYSSSVNLCTWHKKPRMGRQIIIY